MVIFIFVFLFSASLLHATPENVTPDSLSAFIQEKITALEVTPKSGVGIAVIKDGKVFLAKGYGYKNRSEKLASTENTLFAIGSTTKAFTAAALMMQQEEGRLSLSAPIKNYLPEFAMKDPVATAEMSAEDLMTHRSGLPRHEILWYFTNYGRYELYERLKFLDPNPQPEFQFRKGFQYNNLMYMTAGVLLERLSSTNWETFVTQRIFEKLRMKDTQVYLSEVLKKEDRALPYFGEKPIPYKDIQSVGPAGSIYSSASDMAKWAQFLINSGVSEKGERLLSATGIADLFKPRILVEFGSSRVGYGLGWIVPEDPQSPVVAWHNGSIDGFSAHVSVYPAQKMGVIILTNETGEQKITVQLTDMIYKKLLGIEDAWAHPLFSEAAARMDLPSLSEKRITDAPTWAIPGDFSGQYSHRGYGKISLMNQGDQWFANYFGNIWPISEPEPGRFSLDAAFFSGLVKFPLALFLSSDKTKIYIKVEANAPAAIFERVP